LNEDVTPFFILENLEKDRKNAIDVDVGAEDGKGK
jgi:hypothetical protein